MSTERRSLLKGLSASLGPVESGLYGSERPFDRDATRAHLIVEAPWDSNGRHIPPNSASALEENKARFNSLCNAGNAELKPQVLEVFKALFSHYVAEALAGDFSIKRIALPELDQSLYRFGRHLVAADRCVRPWLESAPETGRDFVLSVALGWLEENPSAPLSMALLEMVARHSPSGPSLRAIEPLWRHSNAGIARAAIAALSASGEGARGLELSLCSLAESTDPRLLTQALEAHCARGTLRSRHIALEAHCARGTLRSADGDRRSGAGRDVGEEGRGRCPGCDRGPEGGKVDHSSARPP